MLSSPSGDYVITTEDIQGSSTKEHRCTISDQEKACPIEHLKPCTDYTVTVNITNKEINCTTGGNETKTLKAGEHKYFISVCYVFYFNFII